jgi:hypothetical protein
MVMRLVAGLYPKTEPHRLSTAMKVKKNLRGPVRPIVPAPKEEDPMVSGGLGISGFSSAPRIMKSVFDHR